MIFLKGSLIGLRALEPRDLELLFFIENDSSNWIQSENYFPFSRSILEKYVSGEHDLFKTGQYRFVIEENANASCIGFIDLFAYEPIHQRAGVGVYIQKEKRNKGYAKEAIQLLTEYAKEVVNLELMYCSIIENNEASMSLFMSSGFVKTGERNKWIKVNGERLSAFLYQKSL